MISNASRKGNLLTFTVTLGTPTRSKSAVMKAAKNGIPEEQVPATLLATTGGFITIATPGEPPVKLSLNVTKA
jgi:hypothetical protein